MNALNAHKEAGDFWKVKSWDTYKCVHVDIGIGGGQASMEMITKLQWWHVLWDSIYILHWVTWHGDQSEHGAARRLAQLKGVTYAVQAGTTKPYEGWWPLVTYSWNSLSFICCAAQLWILISLCVILLIFVKWLCAQKWSFNKTSVYKWSFYIHINTYTVYIIIYTVYDIYAIQFPAHLTWWFLRFLSPFADNNSTGNFCGHDLILVVAVDVWLRPAVSYQDQDQVPGLKKTVGWNGE